MIAMTTFHDRVAAAIAIILVLAIVGLAAFSREAPQLLGTAFSVAIGYVFRGGVNGAALGLVNGRRLLDRRHPTDPPE